MTSGEEAKWALTQDEIELLMRGYRPTNTGGIAMPNPLSRTPHHELLAQKERIEAELARRASLPPEPRCTAGSFGVPVVIRFTKRFNSGWYDYAAIRNEDEGLWYTTGPHSSRGYTWEELLSWVDNDEPIILLSNYRIIR